MYGEINFSNDILSRWSDVLPTLIEDAGLLHVQMSSLAKAIEASFRSGDARLAHEILAFLEDVLSRADAIGEIENAVAISFLDLQVMRDLGVLEELPPRIAATLLEQQRRWQRAT